MKNLRANDQIVTLYRSGYLDQAQQSRDISEYAYRQVQPACLIFSTRNAVTGLRNSATGRRWRLI